MCNKIVNEVMQVSLAEPKATAAITIVIHVSSVEFKVSFQQLFQI